MNDKDFVLATMRKSGKAAAQALQAAAPSMTGTEINAQDMYLPDFNQKRQYKNYQAGYVCKSPAGRAVKLLQPYDSEVYPAPPEELPAQWGFYWSTDPAKALPFISLSTSPYNKGDCCTHAGHVWRSGMDGNVWAPGTTGAQWEDLGEA